MRIPFDADPDPDLLFDADPDRDFYLMRMRIRMWIQANKSMRIHADPADADPQHWFSLVIYY
jgi:hypothetical protein